MYINRIDPRPDYRPIDVKAKRKGAEGGAFADTMASIIEMDVVEIGHSTDDEDKKNQKQNPQQQHGSLDSKHEEAAAVHGLDIKV